MEYRKKVFLPDQLCEKTVYEKIVQQGRIVTDWTDPFRFPGRFPLEFTSSQSTFTSRSSEGTARRQNTGGGRRWRLGRGSSSSSCLAGRPGSPCRRWWLSPGPCPPAFPWSGPRCSPAVSAPWPSAAPEGPDSRDSPRGRRWLCGRPRPPRSRRRWWCWRWWRCAGWGLWWGWVGEVAWVAVLPYCLVSDWEEDTVCC